MTHFINDFKKEYLLCCLHNYTIRANILFTNLGLQGAIHTTLTEKSLKSDWCCDRSLYQNKGTDDTEE